MPRISRLLAPTRHLCRVLSIDTLHLLRWPFISCRPLIVLVITALVGDKGQHWSTSGTQTEGAGATVRLGCPVLLRRGEEGCPGQEHVDNTFQAGYAGCEDGEVHNNLSPNRGVDVGPCSIVRN